MTRCASECAYNAPNIPKFCFCFSFRCHITLKNDGWIEQTNECNKWTNMTKCTHKKRCCVNCCCTFHLPIQWFALSMANDRQIRARKLLMTKKTNACEHRYASMRLKTICFSYFQIFFVFVRTWYCFSCFNGQLLEYIIFVLRIKFGH